MHTLSSVCGRLNQEDLRESKATRTYTVSALHELHSKTLSKKKGATVLRVCLSRFKMFHRSPLPHQEDNTAINLDAEEAEQGTRTVTDEPLPYGKQTPEAP